VGKDDYSYNFNTHVSRSLFIGGNMSEFFANASNLHDTLNSVYLGKDFKGNPEYKYVYSEPVVLIIWDEVNDISDNS
jgi:hypothetical protein